MFEGVLKLEFMEEVSLVAYANDLMLLTAERTEDKVIRNANHTVQRVSTWSKLKTCNQYQRKHNGGCNGQTQDQVDQYTATRWNPSSHVKYLGVWFSQTNNFNQHLLETVKKAERLTYKMGYLIVSKWGPRADTTVDHQLGATVCGPSWDWSLQHEEKYTEVTAMNIAVTNTNSI